MPTLGNYILSGTFTDSNSFTVSNQRLVGTATSDVNAFQIISSTSQMAGGYNYEQYSAVDPMRTCVSSNGKNMVTVFSNVFLNNIYTSQDYGVTWTQQSNLPTLHMSNNYLIYTKPISPVNFPNVFYISTCNRDGAGTDTSTLYRSSDGGITWTSIFTSTSVNYSAIAVSDDDTILNCMYYFEFKLYVDRATSLSNTGIFSFANLFSITILDLNNYDPNNRPSYLYYNHGTSLLCSSNGLILFGAFANVGYTSSIFTYNTSANPNAYSYYQAKDTSQDSSGNYYITPQMSNSGPFNGPYISIAMSASGDRFYVTSNRSGRVTSSTNGKYFNGNATTGFLNPSPSNDSNLNLVFCTRSGQYVFVFYGSNATASGSGGSGSDYVNTWYVSSDYGASFTKVVGNFPNAPLFNNNDMFFSYVVNTSTNYLPTTDSEYSTYDKTVSLDWNGQYFVLTARNEITGKFSFSYSVDGLNWATSLFNSNLLTKSPYSVKSLGDKFLTFGNVNTSSQSCLVNIVDGSYAVAIPTNLSNTTVIYDLERNVEQQNQVVFPRTVVLGLGSTISYSLDQGQTWNASPSASTLFSSSANDAVWNGKIWVAGGSGTVNTLATSLDGINWVGRGKYIFTESCNGVDWSPQQRKFVAIGSGFNYILATSMDGIYWIGTNSSLFNIGCDIKWNGKVWVAIGYDASENKKIAYSSDAVSWSYASAF